ncbi:MAG: hypothetical protein ACC662_00715 [Planctomycetota bacterium]
MRRSRPCPRPLLLVALLALLLAGWLALPAIPARADDGPSADGAEGPAAPPEAAADAQAAPPVSPRLHKIYIPFRDLSKVFEKENEGVFLPYDEFIDLWRRARAHDARAGQAPAGAIVRSAVYRGRAEGDLVTFEAELEIEVLAKGWQEVALDFAGAGLERAEVDETPALLLPAKRGYRLLIEKPGLHTLALSFRVAARADGDEHKAAFSLPPVPLARLTLDVPGPDAEVKVEPHLASTTQTSPDGTTRLLAFLGPVGRVELVWKRRAEEAPREEPLVFADEKHDVRLDLGVVRAELDVTLSVLRAPLGRLVLDVPADAVILYVQGDRMRNWARSEDGRRIEVTLREPAKETWRLRVGLERPLGALPADAVLPLAFVEGVERETGFLRILAGDGVNVEDVRAEGLLQVDASELPKTLRGAAPRRAAAYRFPARPPRPTVRAEALEPRVTVARGTRVVIRPEGTEVRAAANVTVERAGIFSVTFALPEALEVTAVRVKGVTYDDHQVETREGRRVLVVAFRDRLLGTARVEVDGRIATPLPKSGAEDAGEEVPFPVPLPLFEGADHLRGYLAIHLDPALEQREVSKRGLTPMDASAPAALEPPAVEGTAAPLAYRFEYLAADASLTLALKRRAPQVRAQVETSLRLEPDRTRLSVLLRYDIRYRGIDTLRFTAPLALEGRLHLDLEGAQLLGPVPLETEDGPGPRGVWTVKLPADRQGRVPLSLAIDDVPEKALASGQSRRVVLPVFVPWSDDDEPLANTVFDVAVQRDPLLEVVTGTVESAEEIDPRELPSALRGEENFLAFRAYDPTWSIEVAVTRHDYEPIAGLVVSHLHLDTVVHGDRATTEAYFVVRNNDRQYLELRLPEDATIRAVRVDGKSRTPRRGEEGAILVPLLSGLGKDQAFVVAVAYDHGIDVSDALLFRTVTLSTPRVLDATSDLLTWRFYMPADRKYTAFGGTLEPDRLPRSWFASLVDGLFRTLGRHTPGRTLDVAQAAGGFQSPLAMSREGRVFLFSNRVGTGTVSITSASPGAFSAFTLFVFALFFVAASVLARLAGRMGLGGGAFLTAVVLVLLVLLVRAGPGKAAVLNAALFGTLLAGLFRFGLAARRSWQARRAARAAGEAGGGDDPGDEPPAPEEATPAVSGGAA